MNLCLEQRNVAVFGRKHVAARFTTLDARGNAGCNGAALARLSHEISRLVAERLNVVVADFALLELFEEVLILL